MSTQVTSELLLRLMELQAYRNVIMEAQEQGECVRDMITHFEDELDDLVSRWNEVKTDAVINSNDGDQFDGNAGGSSEEETEVLVEQIE